MTAPAGSLADLRAKNGRKAPWKLQWFGIGNAGDTNKVYKIADNRITIKDVPKPGVSGLGRHELKPRGFSLALHRLGNRPVIETSDATLWDIGDKVLLLEFHSKMNTIGADAVTMMNTAVKEAKASFDALVVGNQGDNFSVGANLMLGREPRKRLVGYPEESILIG